MTSNKRTVVVTGASGFVGRHVVRRLLDAGGFRVRCLMRNPGLISEMEEYGSAISFSEGDITESKSLARAFEGAWGVVNLAGYREFWSANRRRFYDVNEQGAINVYQACISAHVSKVVQVSTPLAWGVPRQIPFDEETLPGAHPSDYARSKFKGDEAGWRLHEQQGLPLTVVYLAAVIGAGDDKATMEVRRAVEGKLPALVGADTTYTYVHVSDAAEAIVRALTRADSVGRKYLIGNQRASTRDYFEIIGRLAGVPIPSRNIPEKWLMPVARGMEIVARLSKRRPVLPIDVLKTTAAGSLIFDSSRSEQELGMNYASLESALRDSVEEIQQLL